MRVIELSKGQVAVVDDADFQELAQYKWYCTYYGYAARGIRTSNNKRSVLLMHVAIMNPPAGFEIDHKNLNRLDNRRCNLRIATSQQNKWNKPAQKNNKLGVKGVSLVRKTKRYVARIKVNGKYKFLGTFKTVEAAKSAYDFHSKLNRGDFSYVN